jgi:predicted  nucleic acid-binding Zn-ribbon protein
MIFTFGAACRAADKIRDKLNATIGTLKAETAAANKINQRFFYFDGLKTLASTLTDEASGILDTAKDLRTKLEGTRRELEQDFTDDEIDDQLGDIDFANDFAEQLYEALQRLDDQCVITITDCKERKERLKHALIWAEFGVVEEPEAPKLI